MSSSHRSSLTRPLRMAWRAHKHQNDDDFVNRTRQHNRDDDDWCVWILFPLNANGRTERELKTEWRWVSHFEPMPAKTLKLFSSVKKYRKLSHHLIVSLSLYARSNFFMSSDKAHTQHKVERKTTFPLISARLGRRGKLSFSFFSSSPFDLLFVFICSW